MAVERFRMRHWLNCPKTSENTPRILAVGTTGLLVCTCTWYEPCRLTSFNRYPSALIYSHTSSHRGWLLRLQRQHVSLQIYDSVVIDRSC